MPGLGCVLALLEDPAAGRLEQLVVLEEEEMGVEDRRAVIAGAGGDGVAGGADLGPDPLEGLLERLQLRLRVGCLLRGNLGRRRAEVASRPERDPGSSRQPDERTGWPRVRARHWRCRRLDGGLLVEIACRQRFQRGERVTRLRAARGDCDLVALAHSEGRDRVEAAPARGAASRRHVRDGDDRIEAAGGLDEACRRASMQAERVPHGQRDRPTPIAGDRGDGSSGLT